MLSSTPRDHEYFEQLCAMEAIGEITEAERSELQRHLIECHECRPVLADFKAIVKVGVPSALDKQSLMFKLKMGFDGQRIRRRFVAKAAREGIVLPELSQPSNRPYQFALAGAALTLVVVAGAMVFQLRDRDAQLAQAQSATAALRSQVASLELKPAELKPAVPQTMPVERIVTVERAVPTTDPVTKQQLADLQKAVDAAQAELTRLRDQLAVSRSEVESLKGNLQTAKASGAQVEQSLHTVEVAYRQANDELSRLRTEHASSINALTAQKTRVQEINDELRDQRSLLAADRDIRDLMSARNLRIVDVQDVDSKGKTSGPVGRVFLTEGKSLIFYAFDLNESRPRLANASFQAWGQRESKSEAPRNLGIFYKDDQKQNTWVLRLDDPKVLAQIDSVFVTIEPSGGSAKPKGKQLLYAYLKADANHP
ncbi:MAG TPA: hypothetical protein VKU01_14190 [Bryobacteraceae bacterium]|nr:hypothetical protein [Bryobacteraceae bacterium]